MHPYLREIQKSNILFVDTETESDNSMWSIQVSTRPGTAAFIKHDQKDMLNFLRGQFAREDMLTVVHNAPFDIRVMKHADIIPSKYACTMQMAYLLQSEPQGLKPLAFRHAGMSMQSFTDVTKEHTRRKALLYLAKAVEMSWPDPKAVLTWPTKGPKAGTYHIRQPQNIAKKIAGILRDATLKDADPYERWNKIDPADGRDMVEEKLGPLTQAYLSDIPFADATYYANRDPDATARTYYSLWPMIQAMELEDAFWTDMQAMEMVLDMMDSGIEVDIPYLKSLSTFFESKLNEISADITRLTGQTINPRSYEQVSDLLFKDLKLRTLKKFNSKGYHPTGDEILAQLISEHPVVQKIRDYREYAKYRSTYTETIPGQVDEDGRIRPTLNMTRTGTGRLSCKAPNLQNIPVRKEDARKIRKGFVVQDDCSLVAIDYCLSGDTEVITTEGILPIKDITPGTGVLSCKSDTELCISRVTHSACVGIKPTVKVHLDDGSSVICTPEHKWKLRQGPMIETQDLKVGDRLEHIKNGVSGRYPTWYIYSYVNYIKCHRAICEFTHGPTPDDHHVDHIDGDIHNWVSSNLRPLKSFENYAQGGQRYWSEVKQGKRSDGNRLSSLRVGLSKRRSYNGSGNPNYGKLKGKSVTCHNCGSLFYASPSRKQKYCTRQCYSDHQKYSNHKVTAITLHEDAEVYQLTVEDTHNYVLGNGLVSGNSQIELRMFGHYSQDPELLDVYNNDGDIHTKTGCHTFNMTPEELPEYPHRRSAKTTNFGVAYEITAQGLYEQLVKDGVEGWTVQDCEGFITSWLELYSGVLGYRKGIHSEARQNGFVRDLSGRVRYVPGVRCKSPWIVAEALRQAGNMPIQGSAAYVLKKAMCLLPAVYKFFRNKGYIINPLLQVHDELIFEIQDDLIPMVVPIIKTIMENVVQLTLPTPCDVEIGKSWGELEHWEVDE